VLRPLAGSSSYGRCRSRATATIRCAFSRGAAGLRVADDLLADDHAQGLQIDPDTNRNGSDRWYEFDLGLVVAAITSAIG
jgi:hypothetical protein